MFFYKNEYPEWFHIHKSCTVWILHVLSWPSLFKSRKGKSPPALCVKGRSVIKYEKCLWGWDGELVSGLLFLSLPKFVPIIFKCYNGTFSRGFMGNEVNNGQADVLLLSLDVRRIVTLKFIYRHTLFCWVYCGF